MIERRNQQRLFIPPNIGTLVGAKPPSAAPVAVSDNFNRSNENPIAGNWSQVPNNGCDLQLISNRVAATADFADPFSAIYWSADSFNADQYSQATAVTKFHLEGVVVRASSSASTFYMFVLYNPTNVYRLYRQIAGSKTQIGSDYGATASGDVLKLEISGTTLTPYINGTPQTTVEDSNISAGSPGVVCYDQVAYVDDWSGGDL